MVLDLLDKPHKARLHSEKPSQHKVSLLDAFTLQNQQAHSQLTADD